MKKSKSFAPMFAGMVLLQNQTWGQGEGRAIYLLFSPLSLFKWKCWEKDNEHWRKKHFINIFGGEKLKALNNTGTVC